MYQGRSRYTFTERFENCRYLWINPVYYQPSVDMDAYIEHDGTGCMFIKAVVVEFRKW